MNMNDDINMFFKSKRDQYTVEIRKQKNELVLQEKRRKLTEGSSGKIDVLAHSSLSRSQQFVELTNNFYEAFKVMNYEKLAESAELIRRAVSNDEAPPLSDLLATGVVPHILKLLEFEYFEHEQMVLECSWIIANLASGTRAHVHYLVSHGAIKKALDLIRHPQESVKDNAIWILANIAGDSFENRDLLIENEIVPVLTGLLEDSTFSIAFVCHVSWLISNLCRGKPYAPYADVEPLLKIVQFFIFSIDHAEVLSNCMWTLSYLSDGDDAMIKAVLDLNVSDTILEMAMSDNDTMVAPALRTAGNLLTGRDDLTERMIEKEVLKILSHLLGSSRKVFRKEACWGISNITAGASHQIEEVFAYNQGEIVKKLIYMVYNDELDIARECMFCLTNACSEGSAQHIQILVDYEIIDLLVKTLEKSHEPTLLKVSLEALENILERGKEVYSKELDRNPYIIKLAQSDGHGVIEALQSHPDNDVYKVVARIIENHLDYVLD